MPHPHEPGTCLVCEQPKASTFYHAAFEGPVCQPCYQRTLQPRYPCLFCRRKRPATVRLSEDEGICASCYATRVYKAHCRVCRKVRRIARQTDTGRCQLCGRSRRIQSRLEGGVHSRVPGSS